MIASSLKRVQTRIRSSRFARGAATTFAVRVFGAALAYATQVYLARSLGDEQLGVYAFAWTWLTALAFLTPLGFDTSLIRLISSFGVKEQWARLSGSLRVARRTTVAVSLAVTAVWFGAVYVFARESAYRDALLLAPLGLPLLAFINLYEGIARGFHWVGQIAIPSYVVRPLLFLLFAFVAFEILDARLGSHAILAFVSAGLGCVAYQAWRCRRALPRQLRSVRPAYETRAWIALSWPMMAIASFQLLLANTDILMMGFLEGPAPTGVYNIAVRTASCLLFVTFAVTAYASPRISELFAAGRRTQLFEFCSRARLAMFVPTACGAVLLWFAGPALLSLFGRSFEDALMAMRILSIAVVLRAAAGPLHSLMTMTGQQKSLAWALAVAALVNVVANALLIPRHGGAGAATATAISVVLELALCTAAVGLRTGYWPWRRPSSTDSI